MSESTITATLMSVHRSGGVLPKLTTKVRYSTGRRSTEEHTEPPLESFEKAWAKLPTVVSEISMIPIACFEEALPVKLSIEIEEAKKEEIDDVEMIGVSVKRPITLSNSPDVTNPPKVPFDKLSKISQKIIREIEAEALKWHNGDRLQIKLTVGDQAAEK